MTRLSRSLRQAVGKFKFSSKVIHNRAAFAGAQNPCLYACSIGLLRNSRDFATSGDQLRTERSFTSLSKTAATQPADYDPKKRWMAVPPANLVHLSIGGVYVYSMWTAGMTQAVGVVASAASDWSHADVLPVFSAAAVTLGLTTASLGSWVEKVGPRTAGFVGSIFWSAGLVTSGAGVYLHSLPALYLGYGLLGGVGWGLMYLSPVTTVMKWFPDMRGFATGIALSAFGAGAAIAPGIIHPLIEYFAVAPEFIGPLATEVAATGGDFVTLTTLLDGSQVVAENSTLGTPGEAVVVATETDIAKHANIDTGAGAYKLGTGDTGVGKSLAALGLGYGAMGMVGSRFTTLPHPRWTPDGPIETEEKAAEIPATPNNDVGLDADFVSKSTSQFPLLWLSVFGNATGGLALLSSSKLMITDIWTGIVPSMVTPSFATGYVSTLGIGMAVGRFSWSAISDYLGRKNTYAIFGLGIPIVGLAPYLAHTASLAGPDSPSAIPMLATFYCGSVLAITFYGGVFSTLPAYIADLFGQKHSGAIHGKLLTAWAASAVAGPIGLAHLRSQSAESAIQDLLGQVKDTAAFEQAFGCQLHDTETIHTLIEAKTLTIGRLMELVPLGTVDPTPFLYDSSMYVAAGLMGMSFLANLAIQPLDYVKIANELEKEKDSTR